MRVTLACMVTLALLSCAQPTDPEVVYVEVPAEEAPEEPVTGPVADPVADELPSSPVIPDNSEPEEPPAPDQTPEPEPEPEPEPAWQPEDGTLYLFHDEPGGELYISETPTPESWRSRYFVYRQYAQDNGLIFVAGTPPEGA